MSMDELSVRQVIKFSNKIYRNWLLDFPGVLLSETNRYYEIGLDLDLFVVRFDLSYVKNNTIALPILNPFEDDLNNFTIYWGDGKYTNCVDDEFYSGLNGNTEYIGGTFKTKNDIHILSHTYSEEFNDQNMIVIIKGNIWRIL
jgi:hypothetical protein